MENESTTEQTNHPAITLLCVRKDGERERTRLTQHSMSDARDLAIWVLHVGNGFYTQVEICVGDRISETIQNSEAMNHVGM